MNNYSSYNGSTEQQAQAGYSGTNWTWGRNSTMLQGYTASDRIKLDPIQKTMDKLIDSNEKLLQAADNYISNTKTNGVGIGEKSAFSDMLNKLGSEIAHNTEVQQEILQRSPNLESSVQQYQAGQDINSIYATLSDEDKQLLSDYIQIAENTKALQVQQSRTEEIRDSYQERQAENMKKYGLIGGNSKTFAEDVLGSGKDVIEENVPGASEFFDAISSGKWDKAAEIILPAALTALGVTVGVAGVGFLINKAYELISGDSSGGFGSGSGGGSNFLSNFASSALNMTSALVSGISQKLDSGVDDAVAIYADSMGKVNSRLLGSGINFAEILDEVRSSIGSSMLVNEKTLITQIVDLSRQGINYNLEQRALLETLKEDLVPTFSALDGTLTRLVRIQQADLTLSQMGTEAKLLEFLNEQYQDTSYLNSIYDDVTTALTDVLSTQLDTDQMTQFGYAVQKWMGALYSVGVSSQAITSFADAINSLGTGDINKLSDSASNTLMAMVANRAGLSYASLLTEGLTADTTNELMKAMVEILQDIANNTSSNVVKSQWGDILNIEMSDWRALQNLTNEDISNLYNSIVTQQEAENHVATLIGEFLPQNIHLSEQINNALNNTMLSFGMGIANDSEKYARWKLMSVANNITSEIGGQYLGAITNLLSEGFTFTQFKDDILNIPRQLMSLITSGDNGIGNLMAGYQHQMTRGGMNVNSTTSLSESDTIRISNDIANSFLESFGLEDNTSNVSYMDRSDMEDYDSELYAYGDEGDIVSTSSDDYTMTTLQQQDQYVSATAQNIISQDSAVIRDINDLYAELFERQTTPIRVALAKLEDEAKLNIHEAIEGSNVVVSGEVSVEGDVFSSLSGMRG